MNKKQKVGLAVIVILGITSLIGCNPNEAYGKVLEALGMKREQQVNPIEEVRREKLKQKHRQILEREKRQKEERAHRDKSEWESHQKELIIAGLGIKNLAEKAREAINKSNERNKESKKSRNKPPAPLEEAENRPHSRIERPGKKGQYTTYNGDGTSKSYRGTGKSHGKITRPNVKESVVNINQDTGEKFINGFRVRKPKPEEIPRRP
jgi:hypothetical protein